MTDPASPEPRPLPSRTAVDRLIERPAFDHGPAAQADFLAAMREAASWHMRRSPAFAAVSKAQGFQPAQLCRTKDLERLPFIFVSAFKERDLCTRGRPIALELRSSGTSGQRSRMQLDAVSLQRVRRIAWQVFSALGLADPGNETDYLCFTYDPEVAKDLGTAWTDKLLTRFTRAGETFWALRWDRAKSSFYFDREGSCAALERFEASGRPARIVGFPAFALELCEDFRSARGRWPRLHPDSRVITGGGWKDKADQALDKSVFRAQLAERLGLATERVRDLFGMVEHGVPYVDCRLGRFHVPVYSRVLVRDPASLEVLPWGRKGLLQFITPYLASYPSISLLSSDFGRLQPRCPCGLKGPVLELLGRAGVKKLKGCAIAASTLL